MEVLWYVASELTYTDEKSRDLAIELAVEGAIRKGCLMSADVIDVVDRRVKASNEEIYEVIKES